MHLFFSLINKLKPGSVKKINQSALNWHQVSKLMINSFLTLCGCGLLIQGRAIVLCT